MFTAVILTVLSLTYHIWTHFGEFCINTCIHIRHTCIFQLSNIWLDYHLESSVVNTICKLIVYNLVLLTDCRVFHNVYVKVIISYAGIINEITSHYVEIVKLALIYNLQVKAALQGTITYCIIEQSLFCNLLTINIELVLPLVEEGTSNTFSSSVNKQGYE